MTKASMRVLGAMSGTSTDGVDVAALELDHESDAMRFCGVYSSAFPVDLRSNLLRLQNPAEYYAEKEDPLALLALVRKDLSCQYATAATRLLHSVGWAAESVQVFGVHGQTIRHAPEQGYSFQIIDPSLVAAKLNIPVVSDFRSADVAFGGQGAPLVPAFHQAWLRGVGGLFDESLLDDAGSRVVVLNLGGFSNLSVFDTKGTLLAGGDCGPVNCYLDWCSRTYFDREFDDGGELASKGQCHDVLLQSLMQHSFFNQSWPASTGREAFNLEWLQARIAQSGDMSPSDIMATLVEFSAWSIARCLISHSGGKLLLCGGGIKNRSLVKSIQSRLGFAWQLEDFEATGMPAQAVEAAAFAWMAGCFSRGLACNSPVVSGAHCSTVLGVSTPLRRSID